MQNSVDCQFTNNNQPENMRQSIPVSKSKKCKYLKVSVQEMRRTQMKQSFKLHRVNKRRLNK